MCDASCTGCFSFPHGRVSAWALLFAIITVGFAINASWGCFYVVVMIPEDNPKYFQGATGFGLLSYAHDISDVEVDDGPYELSYECSAWTYDSASYFFDSTWLAAMAFGMIANISSFIAMVGALLMSCVSFSRPTLLLFTALLVLACISELLTLLTFASNICSEFKCKFSYSAGFAIGGSISAFVTALLFYQTPSDQTGSFNSGYFAGEPPGTVTVHETVDPDGTKTIVKATVNADGSKTIEETIEHPNAMVY
ncbi:hypothetical protein MHU86_7519 [Fragilaria crotonensis]|nr:hypothetical protein MHU86_7519 [Fragilaria crotonensis]